MCKKDCKIKKNDDFLDKNISSDLVYYSKRPMSGKFDDFKSNILRFLPVCMHTEFKRKKSKFVKPGCIIIKVIEHDNRPWWKFW